MCAVGITDGGASPGEAGPVRLADLLDIPSIQALMDAFYELTELPIGLLDPDSNVLVGTGWQDACTKFHRVCPESLAACVESDRASSAAVLPGEFFGYKCRNGMWDVVTPLYVGGEHVANIFVGQFFYDEEVVDLEYFRAQGERFGYDVDAYLAAVAGVPRFSRRTLDRLMRFYARLADQLAAMGDANRRLRLATRALEDANQELEARVLDRTAQLEAVNERLIVINKELAQANRMKDAAAEAKSEFLASMSHELRTPLTSILGFSGTLLSEMTAPLDDEQERQVHMINEAGRHLLELINGVLDFAQLEAGQARAAIEDIDAVAVASDVLESVRPLANDAGLVITAEYAKDSLRLRTDETKVRQILLNLLGNAVKFTAAGGITLRVLPADGFVRFEVADTGMGIAAADQAHVFDRFYQARPADGATVAGTGLGLSVSLGLARLLGGDIELQSAEGRGSTFTLVLPVDE